VAERDRLQLGEAVAACGSAVAGRRAVADEPTAAVGEDRGRLIKHAWYYWLLLAEGHSTRRLFEAMLRRGPEGTPALPAPAGYPGRGRGQTNKVPGCGRAGTCRHMSPCDRNFRRPRCLEAAGAPDPGPCQRGRCAKNERMMWGLTRGGGRWVYISRVGDSKLEIPAKMESPDESGGTVRSRGGV
jgi:hypothetical protein